MSFHKKIKLNLKKNRSIFVGVLQHKGQIHLCRDIFLSFRGKRDPPVEIKSRVSLYYFFLLPMQ